MGFFEDMFDPDFMFDSEYEQRRDLRALRETVANDRTPQQVAALSARVDQLQLLCNALVSIIEHKGLATREELEVLVQQIDLLDGVEDGKMRQTWQDAPRCRGCNHYVNPRREVCIYCGLSIPRGEAEAQGPYRGGPAGPSPQRLATCARCDGRVPQTDTYFTETGELVCTSCHQGT